MNTIPRRLRLLQECYNHLYSEVKITLATDKEIRDLKYLSNSIERGFLNLTKPKVRTAICSNNCGFKDTFETDEFGLNYFQAVGVCPACDAPTVYPNGKPTKIEVEFKVAAHGKA